MADLFDQGEAGRRPQKPVNGPAPTTYGGFLAIAIHPAFRLGFLDAQHGKPLDHDHIRQRIYTETPKGALERLGLAKAMLSERDIEIAQYRYEEGRILVIGEGCRCKAWGHPDFPPAQVVRHILDRVEKAKTS